MTRNHHFSLCLLALLALLAGCSDAHERDVEVSGPPLSAAAFARPLLELPLPPTDSYGDLESLIQTPNGYAAFYHRLHEEGKVVHASEHRVFLSQDGVTWTLSGEPEAPIAVNYRSLAYGAGQYLLAGGSDATTGWLLASNDAASWSQVDASLPAIWRLSFLNDRFFALGLYDGVYSSTDGVHFAGSATDAVQLSGIAYGNGAYVVVGSGPIEVSNDGDTWEAVPLDCAWAKACVTPPGAAPVQGYRDRVLFGGKHFYAGGFTSEDGRHWGEIDDAARVPDAYALGWLLKRTDSQLSAWQDGSSDVLHTTIVTDNPEQLDCRSRRCLVLPDALLLVP